ncbi:MAG TPA: 4a-hydroxytetrahydrobiopterin dehydratase, partial [Methylotenera sp.]|nr:4a-hydroxytetrahydrobiopterin dehydratase [Methylotenera sp.]
YLAEAPGWELRDDATKLKRTFKFGNFVDALGLAQHVGALCEAEGHHLALCSRPTKSTAYMKMTSLWQLKSTS